MNKVLEIIFSKKILGPIMTILVAFIIYRLAKTLINKIFNFKGKKVDQNKTKMIKDLISNIVKYFIIVMALLIVLEIYGIDTKALIASLGVLGLVAGLAVQDTLKDLISGITIIIEDQYRIGDTIKVNGFKGEVVSLGMKTTRIKAFTGEILIIPNHLITEVINYSHSKSLAIVDVSIAYESDIDKAIKVLTDMTQTISSNMETIIGKIEVLGVQNLGDSSVDIRIIAETQPLENFGVEREIRKQAKLALDKNKISIPYPQVVVHDGKRV